MQSSSRPQAPTGPLSAAYMSTATSSFSEFLATQAPDLLPGARGLAEMSSGLGKQEVTHGTTIVALKFNGGVLLAGDRRATSGNLIAQRDIDKVFVTDAYSAVAIAGVAGLGLDIVRLYTVELEHYEKIEGVALSLDGKTNKLATMVRSNLEMAMQGLAAVPLFVGFDTEAADPARGGRIVSFEAIGSRYEEHGGYHAIGSGSLFAKSALKKLYDADADAETAVRHAVEALYDAADDDSATGGPDPVRGIYPTIATVTAEDGAVKLPEEQVQAVAEAVVADRRERGE
ncbi:proteasome subunit beta [Sciscionella sediminilitoris]|uniref:proteasome subunit beta n=1 Tax=Sciscionella sediminilitoris TaxID=1445613 RepID=UPI0004DF86F2|nr:proteasome subunit beta [Sciscionella sp. SE31]